MNVLFIPDVKASGYRRIPIYPKYLVNSHGHLIKDKGDGRYKEISVFISSNGRKTANINIGTGQIKQEGLHRLVLYAFKGMPPSVHHVGCHCDGDCLNNHPSNLRWATQKENCQDTIRHGKTLIGESNEQSKLTEKKVAKIRHDLANGKSIRSMAREHGVSQRAIQFACRGVTWKHVKQEEA